MSDKEMLFRELLNRIIKAIDVGTKSNGQVTRAITGTVPVMGPGTSSFYRCHQSPARFH